jgi:hypothetical protein
VCCRFPQGIGLRPQPWALLCRPVGPESAIPREPISLRMPEDVVDELKRIAPLLRFSGYQPLIRAYIGQGLRQDVERLSQQPGIERLIESLRRYGVAEEVINSAVAELRSS